MNRYKTAYARLSEQIQQLAEESKETDKELFKIGEKSRYATLRPPSKLDTQIVQYMAEGLTSKEISAKLFKSYRTIENRIQAIYRETGKNRQTAIVAIYMRQGWVL